MVRPVIFGNRRDIYVLIGEWLGDGIILKSILPLFTSVKSRGTTVSRFGIPGDDAHVPFDLSSRVCGAWSVPIIDFSSKSLILTLSSFGLSGGLVLTNVPYIL